MINDSVEFIRLLYLTVQKAMQERKKMKNLKDDFSPEKADPT